jgi:hypothetical protein
MELHEQIDHVDSRAGLAAFVRALRDDLGAAPSEWQNLTLPAFLDAVAAWLADSESLPATADWRALAQILYAGKIYE